MIQTLYLLSLHVRISYSSASPFFLGNEVAPRCYYCTRNLIGLLSYPEACKALLKKELCEFPTAVVTKVFDSCYAVSGVRSVVRRQSADLRYR